MAHSRITREWAGFYYSCTFQSASMRVLESKDTPIRKIFLENDWTPSEEKIARYMKELNIDDTGIMGYIRIQKIDVTLPVYHTTEERVLQRGVGHLSGTSLPALIAPFFAAPILLAGLIWMLITTSSRSRMRRIRREIRREMLRENDVDDTTSNENDKIFHESDRAERDENN